MFYLNILCNKTVITLSIESYFIVTPVLTFFRSSLTETLNKFNSRPRFLYIKSIKQPFGTMTQLVASFLSSMGHYLRNLPNFSSLKTTVSPTQRRSLSRFKIKMIPLWFGRKSRRCYDFARIMSPYVNHRRNARVDVSRAIHTRWKKGKGIVHTADEKRRSDSEGAAFVATHGRAIGRWRRRNATKAGPAVLAVYIRGIQATRQPTRKALSVGTT